MSKTAKNSKSVIPELTDEFLDSGVDLSGYMTNARAVPAIDLTPQKVNIDFPSWVVDALDREANRIGIARQALVKSWVVERLERTHAVH